jgi:hypothetical protein
MLLTNTVPSDTNGKAAIKATALLPAVIEYWLPFCTKEGHRTTLKIALGQDISFNTIIGMPIIWPTKLSLHLINDVVDAGVLDMEPFPVIFRPTIRSKPDFSNVTAEDSKLLLTNSDSGHITTQQAIACRIALSTDKQLETIGSETGIKPKPDANKVTFAANPTPDQEKLAALSM